MRPIDADALNKKLQERVGSPMSNELYEVNMCIIEAPTLVTPVTHGRWLNLDKEIAEKDKIMDSEASTKDKDPNSWLKYSMARTVKIYLLQKYAAQNGIPFTGRWEKCANGERCSVCRLPKDISELNGECVGCGAKMDAGEI